MRFASVDHTDEEPHRRLNCVQQSAAPFFTAPVRTGKSGACRTARCALELKVRRGRRGRSGEAVTCHRPPHLSSCEQPRLSCQQMSIIGVRT